MRKWHWLIGLFSVSIALSVLLAQPSPRAMALTNPCAQDPNNLTTNGSMQGPGHNTAFGVVADGWTPFVLSAAIPHFEWVNNEQSPGDPYGSQHIWADLDQFDAGIYQTINNLTPGAYYHFWLGFARTAYDPADGNPRNLVTDLIGRQVGVDVTGGAIPSAPGILWGSVYTYGVAAINIPALSMTFTAQTANATIFLRAINQNTIGRSKVWFDSICMEYVNAPPASNHVYLPLIASVSAPAPVCTVTNVATVTVGAHPKGIAADPANNRVYVGLFDSSQVAVIDSTMNQVTATWSTNDSGRSNGIGFTNGRLFVSMRDTSRVSILDAATGAFVVTRTVGSLPYGVGAANGKVWVANYGSGTVSVIDALSTNIIATPTVGGSASLVAPTSDRAYVSYWDGGIAVVGSNGASMGNITSVGGGTFGVAANAGVNRVYATNRVGFTTNVVDTSTNLVIQSITEPAEPFAIAFNPTTNHLFIVLPTSNIVRVRDATTLAFVADKAIGTQNDLAGDGGDGIVVAGSRVYISNFGAGTVSVISDTCQ